MESDVPPLKVSLSAREEEKRQDNAQTTQTSFSRRWAGRPEREEAVSKSSAFSDVQGYRLASGWYGILLGPFPRDDARTRLSALKDERLVPGDSFLASGNNFRGQFWPDPDAPAAEPPPLAAEMKERPAIAFRSIGIRPATGRSAEPSADALPAANRHAPAMMRQPVAMFLPS